MHAQRGQRTYRCRSQLPTPPNPLPVHETGKGMEEGFPAAWPKSMRRTVREKPRRGKGPGGPYGCMLFSGLRCKTMAAMVRAIMAALVPISRTRRQTPAASRMPAARMSTTSPRRAS